MLVLIFFQGTESGVKDVGEARLAECRARVIMRVTDTEMTLESSKP